MLNVTVDANMIGWFIVAVMNLATGILAWRTHTKAVSTEKNMIVVEKATNSIKDALVAATAKASFANGLAAGNREGDARAAAAAAAVKSTPLP